MVVNQLLENIRTRSEEEEEEEEVEDVEAGGEVGKEGVDKAREVCPEPEVQAIVSVYCTKLDLIVQHDREDGASGKSERRRRRENTFTPPRVLKLHMTNLSHRENRRHGFDDYQNWGHEKSATQFRSPPGLPAYVKTQQRRSDQAGTLLEKSLVSTASCAK